MRLEIFGKMVAGNKVGYFMNSLLSVLC